MDNITELHRKFSEIFGVQKSLALTSFLISTVYDKTEDYPTKDDGFYEYKTDRYVPNYHELGNFLKNVLKVKFCNSQLYVFNGKYYEIKGEYALRQMILYLTEKRKPNAIVIEGFFRLAKIICYDELVNLSNTQGLINLDNGVYNIKKQELVSHSADYNFLYCLPYDYNPNADCPRFQKFLCEVLKDNQKLIDLIYEFCGYILEGGKPYMQKALFLLGDGNNGKSTLLEVLKKLFGKDNVSSVKPEELKQRFQTVGLYGKIVNITQEFNTDKVDSDYFKEIVGGGTVNAEHKGKPHFYFDNTARFIISSNQMPKFADSSTGLTRRLLLVPFDYYIKEANFNIEEELCDELSGIFNLCIIKLLNLKERRKFSEDKTMSDLLIDYKSVNDSIFAFIQDNIKFDVNNQHKWKVKDIYCKYKDYCNESRLIALSLKNFEKKFLGHIKTMCRDESLDIDSVHKRTKNGISYQNITFDTDFI